MPSKLGTSFGAISYCDDMIGRSARMGSTSTASSTVSGEDRQTAALPGGIQMPQQVRNRSASQKRHSLQNLADTVLKAAAAIWLLVAIVGQWIFVVYIVSFHGRAIVVGDLARVNKVLPHGYVDGNAIGNITLAVHLLFAATITVSGALQLIPRIRTRFPVFHRWNGRIYVLTAFTMGITGLYLALSGRKVVGDISQNVAININAILIMVCAAMAWRYAVARDFKTHRRWALRLFLVVGGVWFFRVGLMFWLFLNKGPVGFDPETFTGPFLTILAFGQYLLPLAMLEIYLRTQERGGALGRFATAAALLVLTVAMGAGTFAATMGMWLPRIY